MVFNRFLISVFILSLIFRFLVYEKCLNYILTYNHPKYNTHKYVSLSAATFDSRRTGNLMFTLAALLYVANRTKRIPILPESIRYGWIDHLFMTNLTRMENSFLYNKSVTLKERFGPLTYDPIFDNPHSNETIKKSKVLLICGYFQSFRYATPIENEIRKHLAFKQETRNEVNKFINKSEIDLFPSFDSLSTIGIHIRRGDFNSAYHRQNGFVVVNEDYIRQAVNYHLKFSRRKHHLIFIASDEIGWVKKAFEGIVANLTQNVTVVFSQGHSAIFDMCLISSCDRIIISTGTFSWWAGWLANTSTVYYSLYPTPNTTLSKSFKKEDYYKQEWIGLPRST